MPYGPFDAALSSLSAADLNRLVSDGIPEGTQVDYKEDLSEKSGGPSAWRRGEGTISDRAKRELARMVVGFANAEGGTVIVGIRESENRPSRPMEIVPLPAVADLADRLRRALIDLIDPKPDRLDVFGVVTEGNTGAVVMRTPPSLNAPHRVSMKDGFGVYVRRGDQTVEATMREVHDIVLRRESGVERFERTFHEARKAFEAQMAAFRAGPINPAEDEASINSRLDDSSSSWAVGWSIFLAPMTKVAVEFEEIVRLPGGTIFAGQYEWAEEESRNRLGRATRILGGRTDATREQYGDEGWRDVRSTWFRDGRGIFSRAMIQATAADPVPSINPAWLTDPILDALIWARAVREHVGDLGLGFGMQVRIDNLDGARMVREASIGRASRIVPAAAASAIYEVGSLGAMERTVEAVMRDAAGAFGDELNNRRFTLRWDDDES